MSSSPPAARTTATDSAVTFPDGNIIIKVESTSFRLYRGLLAARSTFFDDLFSLPPPEQGNEVGHDGCPVVTLYDDESDAKAFFRAIVDCGSFDPPPSTQITNFTELAGILRLATKYDVPFLRKRAIRHIEWYLPIDQRTFQGHFGLYLDNMVSKVNPNEVEKESLKGFMSAAPMLLNLVIELDLTWLIPPLMFVTVLGGLIFHRDTPDPNSPSPQPRSTPESWLDSDNMRHFNELTKRRLYEGWIVIEGLISNHLDPLISRLTRPIPPDVPLEFPMGVLLETNECSDRERCGRFWEAKLLDLVVKTPEDAMLKRWIRIRTVFDQKNRLWDMKVSPSPTSSSTWHCDHCKGDIFKSLRALSKVVWVGLPAIFETQSWSKLKKVREAALTQDVVVMDEDRTDRMDEDEDDYVAMLVEAEDQDTADTSDTSFDEERVRGIVSLVDWVS